MEILHEVKHDTLGQNMVCKLKKCYMGSSNHHEPGLEDYPLQ